MYKIDVKNAKENYKKNYFYVYNWSKKISTQYQTIVKCNIKNLFIYSIFYWVEQISDQQRIHKLYVRFHIYAN